jgi:hypothetical protein
MATADAPLDLERRSHERPAPLRTVAQAKERSQRRPGERREVFEMLEARVRLLQRDGDCVAGSGQCGELDVVTRELGDMVDALSLGAAEAFCGSRYKTRIRCRVMAPRRRAGANRLDESAGLKEMMSTQIALARAPEQRCRKAESGRNPMKVLALATRPPAPAGRGRRRPRSSPRRTRR